jgi:N-acetylglucosamine kinase-like BadF-type ATPase
MKANILIADSGGSKADWRLIHTDGKIACYQTTGINGYFHQTDSMIQILQHELLPQLPQGVPIEKMYFYGAGCGLDSRKLVVREAITQVFPRMTVIEIENDLMAACRAVSGSQEGIVCIIGTGSSASLFDGNDIASEGTSLGYILGDEGGGAYLGKKLVQAALLRKLPEDLQKSFLAAYPITRELILEKVYQQPFPNRYLGSFVPFLKENLNNSYCHDLLFEGFRAFLSLYVEIIPQAHAFPIHFVGSVAFHFQAVLLEALYQRQMTIGKILNSPIEALVEYHLQKEV